MDHFADDVADAYAKLPEPLRLAFESRGGAWAVEELCEYDDLGTHPTNIAGVWVPAEHLVIIYRAPANGKAGMTLHQYLMTVLRHEIGHACGLDHRELSQLGLCNEKGEQTLDHCAHS